MERIERLVAITLLLQARGKMTAKRLAEILGVSTRTIYRDIVALSLAHVPVTMDYGPGGGYYLPEDYHFDPSNFTREEAISLVLGADVAGSLSLFAGDSDLHRALFKLEANLPDTYRAEVNAARKHILLDTTAWENGSTPDAYLETIRTAVLGERLLDILYPGIPRPDASRPGWQCIEPYGLVFRGLPRRHIRTGIWYLVAFCHFACDFRTFRVSNIEDLRLRDEHFTAQEDFDLQSYWERKRTQLEGPLLPSR